MRSYIELAALSPNQPTAHIGSIETTVWQFQAFEPPVAPLSVVQMISNCSGQQVSLSIYAFALKKRQPESQDEPQWRVGVVFSLNNQTQARRSWQFFHRNEVGLRLFSNSLLVHVDCTALSPQSRDDLFIASRDRIAETAFSKTLIKEISKKLKDNPKLRELRSAEPANFPQAAPTQPKQQKTVTWSLYDEDRYLLRFLLEGSNLPMPHVPPESELFAGKWHPSYFCHAKDPADRHVQRQVQTQLCKLTFRTDAVDDYFPRDLDSGEW